VVLQVGLVIKNKASERWRWILQTRYTRRHHPDASFLINIVAYRPVATRWLRKQRPSLGNGRNTHARNRWTVLSVVRVVAVSGQRLEKHVPAARDTYTTTEGWCFLCGPCKYVNKGQSQLIVQLSSARESVKRGPERVKLKNLHC
jgi:hypothetical protein